MNALHLDRTSIRTVAAIAALAATLFTIGGPVQLASHYASMAAPQTLANATAVADTSQLGYRVVVTAQRPS